MKLLGKDISSARLQAVIEERLQARGLLEEGAPPIVLSGPEPRVDPLSFNLRAMEEHADAARPLPLESHRQGLGRAVVFAKWAFRTTCQVFINEAFDRQKLFNGHVRDSYAQLSSEVLKLRAELEALKAKPAAKQATRR